MYSPLEISKFSLSNKKTRAFTLIELIFVIAIIAILLTIGMHKFTGVQRFASERQLHKMEDQLRNIRGQAIRNRNATCLEVNNYGYRILVNGQEVFKEDYVKELMFIETNCPNGRYSFTKRGVPASCGTTTYFAGKDKKFRLVLAPVTSKITLEEVK